MMLTRSQRVHGMLVVILGLVAAVAAPRAAQAGGAYRSSEACHWTCPEALCTGQNCKKESCFDMDNNERPYVVTCNVE